jgi:hypothetical protein
MRKVWASGSQNRVSMVVSCRCVRVRIVPEPMKRAAPKLPWLPRKVTRFVPTGTLAGIVNDPEI